MSVNYDIENLLKVATEAIDYSRDPERTAALEKLLAECGVPENAHVGAPSSTFEGNRKVQIEWAAAQALEAVRLDPNQDRLVRMVTINSVANVLDALTFKGGGQWPPKGTGPKPPLGKGAT